MSEAFRCQGANLLPVTKFIGSGLFIKCLGQVDLPGAPLYITHRQPSPPGSAGLPSALGAVAAVGRVVLRVDGGGYGERDCCGRLCVVLQVGGCGYGECVVGG